MKKTTFALLAMAVSLAVFVSACGGAQSAPTAVPAPTQAPPPVVIEQPTQQQQVPPTIGPSFAPTCQNVASSCTAPEVTDTVASETYCVVKVPYQNILVPEGTTFEALDPDNLTCADNGTIVDGKHVIECHGKELWTTELKLTNAACGGSTLQTGTGQCQDGYGFDAAQNCCAPVTGNTGNSVTIKVNMGACPGAHP